MFALLARLFRENRELSAFIVCTLLSFSLMLLPPPQKDALSAACDLMVRPFRAMKRGGADLAGVRRENEALRSLLITRSEQLRALDRERAEVARIREVVRFLVSSSEEGYLEVVPARVTRLPGVRLSERIEIDKGKRDGVVTGKAVVAPEGVVGKVVSVLQERAYVEPLSAATAGASAVIKRSGVMGIVRPRVGQSSELLGWNMKYLESGSDVVAGDEVVTSGLGGIYPPGLVIGTVTSVAEGPLELSVRVQLAVELHALRQVFVETGLRTAPPDLLDAQQESLLRELGLLDALPEGEEPPVLGSGPRTGEEEGTD